MKFDELNLKKLLPHWMQEEDFDAALANAISDLMKDTCSRYRTLRVWDQIDNLTSSELDELAYELSVDWWDSSWDIDTKRKVIKTCQQIMSKRGTKWAVEQLGLSTLGSCRVWEWFDYGGSPYHFKIETFETLTDEAMAKFVAMVGKIKPARCSLDSVDAVTKIESEYYTAAACRSFMHNPVIAECVYEETPASAVIYLGAAETNCIKNTLEVS